MHLFVIVIVIVIVDLFVIVIVIVISTSKRLSVQSTGPTLYFKEKTRPKATDFLVLWKIGSFQTAARRFFSFFYLFELFNLLLVLLVDVRNISIGADFNADSELRPI